jgi:hypothetical protein
MIGFAKEALSDAKLVVDAYTPLLSKLVSRFSDTKVKIREDAALLLSKLTRMYHEYPHSLLTPVLHLADPRIKTTGTGKRSNLENPKVAVALLEFLDHWLDEFGIDRKEGKHHNHLTLSVNFLTDAIDHYSYSSTSIVQFKSRCEKSSH